MIATQNALVLQWQQQWVLEDNVVVPLKFWDTAPTGTPR